MSDRLHILICILIGHMTSISCTVFYFMIAKYHILALCTLIHYEFQLPNTDVEGFIKQHNYFEILHSTIILARYIHMLRWSTARKWCTLLKSLSYIIAQSQSTQAFIHLTEILLNKWYVWLWWKNIWKIHLMQSVTSGKNVKTESFHSIINIIV